MQLIELDKREIDKELLSELKKHPHFKHTTKPYIIFEIKVLRSINQKNKKPKTLSEELDSIFALEKREKENKLTLEDKTYILFRKCENFDYLCIKQ